MRRLLLEANISVTTKSNKVRLTQSVVCVVVKIFRSSFLNLKIVEMSSNFYQETTATNTTIQERHSLFDLVVTEISARNKIPI